MARRISDTVVVITGASSGIGRAAAHAFAREHAHVVLAARRKGPLHEAAAECEDLGGSSIAVPTDVTDPAAVQKLAAEAADTFGRIDTWVNNAAVTQFGRFEETPPEVFRQVVETNLFGYVHGAQTVLPIFREQGQGVLINMSSVVAEAGQPYTSAYVVSKYGIRGLGVSLREELSVDGVHDIHVCTILPATVDTPLFQHAANYSGRAIKALPPVYSAERVAQAILKCAKNPKPEMFVGNSGKMIALQHKFAPQKTEHQMAMMTDRMHLHKHKAADPTSGNLFEPMEEGTSISGGWKTVMGVHQSEDSMAKDTAMRGVLYGGALVAGALLVMAFVR